MSTSYATSPILLLSRTWRALLPGDGSGKSRRLFLRDAGDEGVTLHQLANGAVRPVYVTDKQRAGNVKAFETLTDDELSAYHAENVRLVDLVLGEHPSSSCMRTISYGSHASSPTRRIRSSCFLTGARSSTRSGETTAIAVTLRSVCVRRGASSVGTRKCSIAFSTSIPTSVARYRRRAPSWVWALIRRCFVPWPAPSVRRRCIGSGGLAGEKRSRNPASSSSGSNGESSMR